jgi:phage baseplate assembly protein W
MSTPRYRAWRFSVPDSAQPGKDAGLSVSNRGGVEMVEGLSSVRQAILMLLATRPGERVMRPHYGCNLHRLVFSPNDDTTAGLAIHYVRQSLERWEPRVEVINLDATRPEGAASPGVLEIYLEYRVRATLESERLAYAFDLTGDRT